MDLEEKNDDKEIDTPAEPSSEDVADKKDEDKKPDEQQAEDPKEVDDKITEKSKQLEQLKEATDEETVKLTQLRKERRSLGEDKPTETDNKEPVEPTVDVKKEALNIFYKNFPDFSPENDIGNEKFNELNKHFKYLRPGLSVAEVYDSLIYVKDNHMTPPAPVEDESKDGDIGSTESVPAKTNQNSALTRKLNRHEANAAKFYPGGEKEYRQFLADKDK